MVSMTCNERGLMNPFLYPASLLVRVEGTEVAVRAEVSKRIVSWRVRDSL